MKIIITENQLGNLFVRRRMDILHDFIKEQFLSMQAERYYNYDVFYRRVALNAITNFLSQELSYDSIDEFIEMRDAALPFMRKFVEKHFGDEIRGYYEQVKAN